MNKPQIYDAYLKEQSIHLGNFDLQKIYDYEDYQINTLKSNFIPNKIIEKAISQHSKMSAKYAKKLFEIFGENFTPNKIIEESIANNMLDVRSYAEYLLDLFGKDYLPSIIIEEGLAKYGFAALKYADYLKKRVFTNKKDVIERYDFYKKFVNSQARLIVYFNNKDITQLYLNTYDIDSEFELKCLGIVYDISNQE